MIFIKFTELCNHLQNAVFGHFFVIPERSFMDLTNLNEFNIRVIATIIQCLLGSELCFKQFICTDSFNSDSDPWDRHYCFPISQTEKLRHGPFELKHASCKAVNLSHHTVLLFNIYWSFEKQDGNSNNYLYSFSV